MLDQSRDLAAKENANRTIVALKSLTIRVAELPANVNRPPQRVVQEFCEKDAKGERLAPFGWQEMSAFFVEPGPPRPKRITVVRDTVVSNASIHDENKAEVVVYYFYLGDIDPDTMVFKQWPTQHLEVLINFVLTLDQHPQSASDKGAAKEKALAPLWRIESPAPEPHVTVDSAIRYVTRIRDTTRDHAIRNSADQTLAELAHFR